MQEGEIGHHPNALGQPAMSFGNLPSKIERILVGVGQDQAASTCPEFFHDPGGLTRPGDGENYALAHAIASRK